MNTYMYMYVYIKRLPNRDLNPGPPACRVDALHTCLYVVYHNVSYSESSSIILLS